MAIFGFHIVLTMVTATFAHRFLPRFAPCSNWFAAYLYRYAMPPKPPEDEKSSGNSRYRTRKRGANTSHKDKDSDSDVLYRVPVTTMDLSKIAFATDMEIVFDFALASTIVIGIAETRGYFYPCEAASEANLSLVWCWISLGLAFRALFITLKIFMRESSFVSVCLMSGCVFSLLSMVVLSFPDNFVDLKLRGSHEFLEKALSSSVNETESSDGNEGASTLNFNLFRGLFALFAGFFGTLLTFPGLRFVKLYAAAINKEEESSDSWKDRVYFYVLRGLLHVALIMPLAMALLWMKPITEAVFNMRDEGAEDKLNAIRTVCMLVMGIVNISLCIPLLQTHLDSAEKRVAHVLTKAKGVTPGRPAEKPVDVRQEVNIASQSLGIVAIQVLAPAIMMLLAGLSFKSLLGVSWLPEALRSNCTTNGTVTSNPMSPSGPELLGQLLSKVSTDDSLTTLATDLATSVSRFRLAASNSQALWQSTVGFGVFWMCAIQLLTSMFGLWHARASAGDPDQTLF